MPTPPPSVLVTLNFDDFHPQFNEEGDFGGDPEIGNFKRLIDLLEEFPGLRISLFTTPNWIDRPYHTHRYYYHLRKLLGFKPVVTPYFDEPFRLDKHPRWCSIVRRHIERGEFELIPHGYYHHNPNEVIHGQEFKNITKEEAIFKLQKAEAIFHKANLLFVKGFRPPGWGMSEGTFYALKEMEYDFIATLPSHSRTYNVQEYSGIKIIPQSYSIKEDPQIALQQAKVHGVVHAKGHIAYMYGNEIIENGLHDRYYLNLKSMIRLLQENYKVEFVFLSEFMKNYA